MAEVFIEFKTIGAKAAKATADSVKTAVKGVERSAKSLGSEMGRLASKTTPTFRRQRKELEILNREFVRLGRSVSGADRFKLGSLGPGLTSLEQQLKKGRIDADRFSEGIRKVRGGLDAVGGSAGRGGREFKKFNKEVEKADGPSRTFNSTLKDIGSSAVLAFGPLSGVGSRIIALAAIAQRQGSIKLGILTAVFAGLAVGIVALASKGAKAISKLEVEFLRLQAILRATGKAATTTVKEIDAIANKVGDITLGSASEVREAAAIGLTFDNINIGNLEKVLLFAQDIAIVMGTKVNASVRRLGELLDKPTQNFEALARAGIKFNTVEKKLLTTMFNLNDQVGIQDFIFGKLQKRLGGAGIGAAGGIAGAVDTITESWNRFLAAVGEILPLEKATALLGFLSDTLNKLAASKRNELLERLFGQQSVSQSALGKRIEELKTLESSIEKITRLNTITGIRENPLLSESGIAFDEKKIAEFGGKEPRLLKVLEVVREQLRLTGIAFSKLFPEAVETAEKALERGISDQAFDEIRSGIDKMQDSMNALGGETDNYIGTSRTLANETVALARKLFPEAADEILKFSGKFVEAERQLQNFNDNALQLKFGEELKKEFFSAKTGAEKFADAVERLNFLFRFDKDAETYKRRLVELRVSIGDLKVPFELARDTLTSFTDGLVDGIKEGKKFMEILRDTFIDVIDNIIKKILELGVVAPILDALFGTKRSQQPQFDFLSALGSLFSGAGGAGGQTAAAGTGSLGGVSFSASGAAKGAKFNVGGTGGTDSQFVGFKASPNETVTVETPQQIKARTGGRSGGGDNIFIDARGADASQIDILRRQLFALGARVNTDAVAAVQEARARQLKE